MEDYEVTQPSLNPQVFGAPALHGLAQNPAHLRLRGRSPVPPGGFGRRVEQDVKQELLTEEERVWGGYVAAASAFDIFSSAVVSAVAFFFAYRTHGVSLVCLGLQSVSHLLSSLLLALRFVAERRISVFGAYAAAAAGGPPGGSEDSDEAEETAGLLKRHRRQFLGREQGLHMGMGIVMLISSVGLAYQAFTKVERWNSWYKDHTGMDQEVQFVTECLAWYGSAVYLMQAVFRYCAAEKLRRTVLWSAFTASLVALVFLVILGFSASYQKEWSWKAEPFAALVLAMATLIEGLRLLVFMTEDADLRMRFDSRA